MAEIMDNVVEVIPTEEIAEVAPEVVTDALDKVTLGLEVGPKEVAIGVGIVVAGTLIADGVKKGAKALKTKVEDKFVELKAKRQLAKEEKEAKKEQKKQEAQKAMKDAADANLKPEENTKK